MLIASCPRDWNTFLMDHDKNSHVGYCGVSWTNSEACPWFTFWLLDASASQCESHVCSWLTSLLIFRWNMVYFGGGGGGGVGSHWNPEYIVEIVISILKKLNPYAKINYNRHLSPPFCWTQTDLNSWLQVWRSPWVIFPSYLSLNSRRYLDPILKFRSIFTQKSIGPQTSRWKVWNNYILLIVIYHAIVANKQTKYSWISKRFLFWMCAMTQGMSIKLPARSRSGELSFCLGVAAHKILTFPDPDGKRIKFRIAASDCVEHFAMLHPLTCCRPWITFTFSITLLEEVEKDFSRIFR